jgi:GNAT superfamily N-acetyltransferase
MAEFKLLIDTNVVIGLEDAQPVQTSLAELVRVSNQHNVGLFVDSANYEDVARDKNTSRRTVTLSKLAKFQKLRGVPLPSKHDLVSRFGPINNDNDKADVRLLVALSARAVDFIVTQDNGLHRRADRAGLGSGVLTVEDALEWLRQTFQEQAVILPYVVERKAYELNLSDSIFSSLRDDYPGFDQWFDKCRKQHRDCWTLEIGRQIAGLVIRKDETHAEAGTTHAGSKILKVCTFKVRDEFRGEKFGELLLKQILWFAQRNRYGVIYITAYSKHVFLIDLLEYYGFQKTKTLPDGELFLEKIIVKGPLPDAPPRVLDFDREVYPRFYDGPTVQKFYVPIKPDYHIRLFPEIAFAKELPLFPNETFRPVLNESGVRTPGNTIRKVYLCRAKTTQLKPGDLLFFYMSKGPSYAASQSITTVGVVEQVAEITTSDELIRSTAKRSVFSAKQLERMQNSDSSPVKMIDFLLVGHIDSPIGLQTLIALGVLSARPPQSITRLPAERYSRLRPHIQLGFDL